MTTSLDAPQGALTVKAEALITRQMKLEYEMLDHGRRRFQNKVNKTIDRGRRQDTPGARRLISEAITPLTAAITEWLKRSYGGRPGRANKFAPLLKNTAPTTAAYITARRVFSGVGKNGEPQTRADLAKRISQDIELEHRLRRFEHMNPGFYQAITTRTKQQGSTESHKRRVLIHEMNRIGIEDDGWSNPDQLGVGLVLSELFIASTEMAYEEKRKRKGQKRQQSYIRLKPDTLQWLDGYHQHRADLSPAMWPMLVEPLDWTPQEDGGYLLQFICHRSLVKHCSKKHRDILSEANLAVERELIRESPLRHLKGGSTPHRNPRYITPEETDRLLNAALDIRWKTVVGLARLAGLRCPSETHLLTWADVDFDKGRLRVRSPKTEHHAGKEERIVPITPKLMSILQDAFHAAPDGSERVVRIGTKGNLRRTMLALVKRSEVQKWDDLWQTLRRSCEQEWAMEFPQFAVSNWIGHSLTVSGKHYANHVPDELFERAASLGPDHDSVDSSTPSQDAENEDFNGAAFCTQDDENSEENACFVGESERVAEGIRTPDPRDHNAML